MAVNTVTTAVVPVALYPQGTAAVAALQSPAGATGDTTFVFDCRPAKSGPKDTMRGRTIQIVNNGTAMGAITSVTTSIDGVSYETAKTIQPATIGANTVEAALTTPAVTSGVITIWVAGHDFNWLKIITTGGDATSGYTLTIGS